MSGAIRLHCVVHENALPQGQGWSPLTWRILKGASRLPITLLEATAELMPAFFHWRGRRDVLRVQPALT